jgi:hypothetical protein
MKTSYAIEKKLQLLFSTSSNNTSGSSSGLIFTGLKTLFEQIEDYIKIPEFVLLFQVKEFLGLRRVCKSFSKLFNRRHIHFAIRLGNLGHSLRCAFWLHKAPFEKYSILSLLAYKNT